MALVGVDACFMSTQQWCCCGCSATREGMGLPTVPLGFFLSLLWPGPGVWGVNDTDLICAEGQAAKRFRKWGLGVWVTFSRRVWADAWSDWLDLVKLVMDWDRA